MAKTIDKTFNGVLEIEHKFDEQEQKWTQSYTQDVESILKRNKEERNSFSGYNQAKDLKKVASIPLVVIYQWLAEDGFLYTELPQHEQAQYLRNKLNSPEWAYLKTSEGII
jgi:hypothetical protein